MYKYNSQSWLSIDLNNLNINNDTLSIAILFYIKINALISANTKLYNPVSKIKILQNTTYNINYITTTNKMHILNLFIGWASFHKVKRCSSDEKIQKWEVKLNVQTQ